MATIRITGALALALVLSMNSDAVSFSFSGSFVTTSTVRLEATREPRDAMLNLYIYLYPGACTSQMNERSAWRELRTEVGRKELRIVYILNGSNGEESVLRFASKYLKSEEVLVDDETGAIERRIGANPSLTPLKILTNSKGEVIFVDTKCADKLEQNALVQEIKKHHMQQSILQARKSKDETTTGR